MNSDDIIIDMDGFGGRLREAIAPESLNAFAERIGVVRATLYKYVRAPEGLSPSLEIVGRIARGAGTSIDYLATGRGDGPTSEPGIIKIPRYDALLAAGSGSFNEGARRIGEMPIELDVLRRMGRHHGDGLVTLEASGDSMEPLIADGAQVIVDRHDDRLREGVFALRFDDQLRLKRLRPTVTGVEILSENDRYEPELITGENLNRFAIIGRVIWAGSPI